MNEMIGWESIPAHEEAKTIVIHNRPREQILDNGRIDGIFEEVLAWMRDDRTNTKRAISSAVATRRMIQEQNMQLMNAYESEFKRPGLTVERRRELLDMMDKTAESGKRTDSEIRAFLNEQVSHSHSRSGQLLILISVIVVGVGRAAWRLNNRVSVSQELRRCMARV